MAASLRGQSLPVEAFLACRVLRSLVKFGRAKPARKKITHFKRRLLAPRNATPDLKRPISPSRGRRLAVTRYEGYLKLTPPIPSYALGALHHQWAVNVPSLNPPDAMARSRVASVMSS